jgi:hypothetical protein
MTSTPMAAITDLRAIRDRTHEEFDASTSSDQRGAPLGMFKATMDIARQGRATTVGYAWAPVELDAQRHERDAPLLK